MNLSLLVGEPCGWDALAPTILRSTVFSDDYWGQYSTSKAWDGSEPEMLCSLSPHEASERVLMDVELLSRGLQHEFLAFGLEFAARDEIQTSDVPRALGDALQLLDYSESIRSTMHTMCRSVVVLKSARVCDDVSFSHPEMPFSIFTSVTESGNRNRVPRLAECLAHEALHLQLSLVERKWPLVRADTETELVYSPWKQEMRPIQGLLHALYVFGNLRCFWKAVGRSASFAREFANERAVAIDLEMSRIGDLSESMALTDLGRRIAVSYGR